MRQGDEARGWGKRKYRTPRYKLPPGPPGPHLGGVRAGCDVNIGQLTWDALDRRPDLCRGGGSLLRPSLRLAPLVPLRERLAPLELASVVVIVVLAVKLDHAWPLRAAPTPPATAAAAAPPALRDRRHVLLQLTVPLRNRRDHGRHIIVLIVVGTAHPATVLITEGGL